MLKECTVTMQARLHMGAADAKSIYARTITNFGMIAAGPKAKICHLHVIAGAMGNKLVVKFVRKRTNHKMDLKKQKHKTQKQNIYLFSLNITNLFTKMKEVHKRYPQMCTKYIHIVFFYARICIQCMLYVSIHVAF